jgi:hypothetical protein
MNNYFRDESTNNKYAMAMNQYVDTGSEPSFNAVRFDNAYTDVNVAPFTASLGPNVRPPSIVKFKDDGAGSTGSYLYAFDETKEQEVFFTIQLPHSYKEGSTIYPHVHFCLPTTPINPATQYVEWGLEYNFHNINDTYGNTVIISERTNGPPAYQHTIGSLPDIVGVGKKISSILTCRLFRKAGGYVGNALLLSFDLHIAQDTLGSRTVLVK